ncbi:MAG: hypothetical protein IJ745_08355 [Bacteroidales bacterium]|nr:hypothetical protein [Bacteroidales bacterium]
MNSKKKYIAPTLTVVEFRIECGFASSGVETTALDLIFPSGSRETESFSSRSGWTDDGDNSFWQ